MIMVRAIVRPEKSTAVLQALQDAGFPAVTKIEVFGRGKQQGLKLGKVLYNELPKDMLLMLMPKADKVYTISSGRQEFSHPIARRS